MDAQCLVRLAKTNRCSADPELLPAASRGLWQVRAISLAMPSLPTEAFGVAKRLCSGGTETRAKVTLGSAPVSDTRISIMTYMSVGNPGRALAPFQPLDELGAVRDSLRDELRRRDRAGRAVEDGTFAQVGPDALLGDPAGEPPFHPLELLYRDRGGIGGLWNQIPRALGPHLVAFTEYRHRVMLKCRGTEVQTPRRTADAKTGRAGEMLPVESRLCRFFGGVLGEAGRADESGMK